MNYVLTFLIGGLITTAITYFEANGWPLLSRLAALFPVFTWLSYLFIDRVSGPEVVSRHALFVLLGTIIAWVPYMLVIYFLAPNIGTSKAILLGIVVFIVLAVLFVQLYNAGIIKI